VALSLSGERRPPVSGLTGGTTPPVWSSSATALSLSLGVGTEMGKERNEPRVCGRAALANFLQLRITHHRRSEMNGPHCFGPDMAHVGDLNGDTSLCCGLLSPCGLGQAVLLSRDAFSFKNFTILGLTVRLLGRNRLKFFIKVFPFFYFLGKQNN
jgi:hypothetical protein